MANYRILVVEDDNVAAHLLRACLQGMGHTVVAVCSFGEDAVDKARELQPDLILMDIMLRGTMSGVEAMQLIRAQDDIPVVYLTGYEADYFKSLNVTDSFDYLLKPFRENELKNVIEIALYRHRMEKALRERELSYHNLVQSLQGIVCRLFLEEDSRMLFFNDMLEKRTGYKEHELPLCRIDSLIIPEDRSTVKNALERAFAEDKPFEVEYRITHKEGTLRHFLERGRVIKPGNGKAPYIDSVILDVTERRMAEEKLEQAYLKLVERQTFIESILSNIQSGIIVTDMDFRIQLLNPSAEVFLGMPARDAISREVKAICPTFADALLIGDDSIEIFCNVCAREHVIGFKLFDMKGKDEAVNGHIISFADLTEIVKIRKEIKVKERLATMGEFVARVAHEIRNPLFGLTAICQIFSMELKLNDAHKKLMDSMMKEAWRLKHLVEELLDCSRELKIVRKSFDLVDVVNESLLENNVFIDEKDISIETHLSEAAVHIDADADKIKQVVVNLVKNAIEASRRQGAISISLKRDSRNVSFCIADAGPGIPETIIDKIFDVFYTTKRHGTGLGLAISKNIVVAHGGALVARNRPEGGASFAFTIPVSA